MQFLLLAVSLVAASSARPDVSHLNNGYNYNRPSSDSFNGVGSSNVPSGSYLPGGNLVQPNFDPRFDSGTSVGNNAFLSGGGISGSNGFVGGTNGYNSQTELIQDQKHVYFFAAPDEEEAPRLRIQIAPSSQKNTKIIFIKAPSQGPVIPEVIAPPSDAEDKTLVYVLVKKQDHPGPITIPAAASVKQAKPEVYFIKYRSKEEAEQAVAGGLGEQAVGSGVQSLADEQAFLRTLKDEAGQVSNFGGIETEDIRLGSSTNGGSSSISLQSGGSGSGGSFNGGGASISGSVSQGKYGPPSLSGPY